MHMNTAQRYGLVPRDVDQSMLMDWIEEDPSTRNFVRSYTVEGTKSVVGGAVTYMGPRSPVTRLALLHSTGTGKTRKSLMIAMQYDKDITIIGVHSRQLHAFESEINNAEILRVAFPAWNKRVDVMTCKGVTTAMGLGDYDRLDAMFQDRIIIVDEVHHIRNDDDKEEADALFDTIHTVLQRYSDAVVLLLTATPLVDKASELRGLYSLLRGDKAQLGDPKDIAASLRGYVSVVQSQNWPSVNHVVECRMVHNGPQWHSFQKFKDDKTSVHSKTGSVSRFFTRMDSGAAKPRPESTEMLVNAALDLWRSKGILARMLRLPSEPEWPLSDELYNRAVMKCIKGMSIKYYKLLKHLLKHRGYPKFIYDSWKVRGGADRLTDVLSLPAVGYTAVSSEAEARSTTTGPHMVVLHRLSTKGSASQATKMIDLFNSVDNADGSLIELMLATPKFAENMTIKTARECHIIMPQWNLTTRVQIVGRVNRRSSLFFLPPDQRVLHNYDYILTGPDGAKTFEHGIVQAGKGKDRDIRVALKALEKVRIEGLHMLPAATGLELWGPRTFALGGINERIRSSSSSVSQRNINVATDVLAFLGMLEAHATLFELLLSITRWDSGFTKHVSIVIHSLETLHSKRARGETLTAKQLAALHTMRLAFNVVNGITVHVLYSLNLDTVEYQRLAAVSSRVARMYNEEHSEWEDVTNEELRVEANNAYDAITTAFADSIKDKWMEAGHYVVRYTLPPCYRLVEYKTDVALRSRKGGVDKRKVSRGEKWQHYPKARIMDVIAQMRDMPKLLWIQRAAKSVSPSLLLSNLLNASIAKGLYTELPI